MKTTSSKNLTTRILDYVKWKPLYCERCRITVDLQLLILLWSQWTWTSCQGPGSRRWMCFRQPWSPFQPLLGSRCWVWHRWRIPGYGASEKEEEKRRNRRRDFIATFFVPRPSLVSGFYPDGLQTIRLCRAWDRFCCSSVYLKHWWNVREENQRFSLFIQKKTVHQSSSTAAERRKWKFGSNTWCIEIFGSLWTVFFFFLQKSENLNISLLLMLYARNPYPQNGNICSAFIFWESGHLRSYFIA